MKFAKSLRRWELLVSFGSFPLDHRLHIYSLLLFEALNSHVFLLRGILNTDIVLVVYQAILESLTLQNLTFHRDFEPGILSLALWYSDLYPLQHQKHSYHCDKEECTLEGELFRLSLNILFYNFIDFRSAQWLLMINYTRLKYVIFWTYFLAIIFWNRRLKKLFKLIWYSRKNLKRVLSWYLLFV